MGERRPPDKVFADSYTVPAGIESGYSDAERAEAIRIGRAMLEHMQGKGQKKGEKPSMFMLGASDEVVYGFVPPNPNFTRYDPVSKGKKGENEHGKGKPFDPEFNPFSHDVGKPEFGKAAFGKPEFGKLEFGKEKGAFQPGKPFKGKGKDPAADFEFQFHFDSRGRQYGFPSGWCW